MVAAEAADWRTRFDVLLRRNPQPDRASEVHHG
jgi:hypothetical protein